MERQMWRAKLGLDFSGAINDDAFDELHNGLLFLFKKMEVDFTIFLRNLSDIRQNDVDGSLLLKDAFYDDAGFQKHQSSFDAWLNRWKKVWSSDPRSFQVRQAALNEVNPCLTLRNAWVQTAIDYAEKGDFSEVETLLEAVCSPYVEDTRFLRFAERRPQWARKKAGCSMLPCSS